ncbi:arsenite efflux transporter metallochaperone ArsD [Salipaludibacillus sp. CF4.18]|uniref:arsenite efflux transporter metallochaperone ArsD n=1 Tax=Salipaludibacillus sp. CF4.18 TaxID=3373081 RepID=UPI003EE4D3B5
MKKIEIYDPAMCCDTGVCGPTVDPELTKLATAIYSLNKKGYPVTRYNLANDPAAFAENEVVNGVLHDKGPDALPIVLVDGEVYKIGEYPSNDEFSVWFNIDENELSIKKPKVRLDINVTTQEGN